MSYRKNTKKKIIAGVLALVMLVQVAVSTFASEELDGSDYEALGSSASAGPLGDSEATLGLSIAPMGAPYASGDISVSLSNNAPAAGFQSYTTGYGAEPPELVTSLTIAVKKAGIKNGKIELDFASEKGHLSTDFFTYDRIGNLPASTIFDGAPTVDAITGKITLKLKDSVALNSTEGISIFHKYNTAEYDGGAPPSAVLAELSARAFVGTEKVYETETQQVKAVNLDMPSLLINYFYPNDGGTAANPSIMSNRDNLSVRQRFLNNEGLFANKFDPSEDVAIKTYLPNGSTASGVGFVIQGYEVTAAESAISGVPVGTYALHHYNLTPDGITGWNTNYSSDINNNFAQHDVSFKLPDDSNGKTYAVHRQASFKHLGADSPTYRPVLTQYVKVDNALGWKLLFSGIHGTGGSLTGYCGIENGDIGDSDIQTGWPYSHTSSQKNVGSVNATQVEKILTQSGAGPARINFDSIKFLMDRANGSVPITPIEYYFVIGSDKGIADYSTAVKTSTKVSTTLSLPTLDPAKGEYIKSVHTSPVGKELVEGVLTDVKGVWPPGTTLRYAYRLKAWPDQKWPDGSTINPGRHPVKIAWTLNYFSPVENKVLSANSSPTYQVGYVSGAPTPRANGAGVPGTTPGSVSPGDEILYRINGYNYNYTAKTTWNDPTIIMRLPAGITLAETTGIELMDPAGVSQGPVTLKDQGEYKGMYYYRLQAPAGYNAPISATPSFYIDVKLKLPAGIPQGNYQPSFALTTLDSENFFATNLGATSSERQSAYGLGANEKFVYFFDNSQTSLGVIGSTKMSSNSMIKSDATGGIWSSDATVAATFGETVGVQLNVVNEGNRALGGFRLYDIVPYGDYLNSSNNCSITLDTISAADSPDFWFYTAAGPPPLSDIQNITLPSAGWVKGMPADKSTIKAFLVDFKTAQLAGGKTLTVDIGFKIPAEAAGEQLANNRFSYTTGEVNASGIVANIQTFDSPKQGFTTASYYIDYDDDFSGETANWPNNDTGILMGNSSVDFLKVTTQVPTRAGYSLKEWNTQADGNGVSWLQNATKTFSPNDKSLKLHAVWIIDSTKTITATYKLAGGNVAGATADILQAGKKVEDTLTLPTPVRIGYTFDGWYEGAAKWEPATKIQVKHMEANGVTLTAKWNVDNSQKVTVKFTTVDTTNVTGMPAAQSLVAGSTVTQPPVPVRPGYSLTGWKHNATPWVFSNPVDTQHFGGTAPNYTMTLEAIWGISDGTGGKLDEKIDVTFDLGGGKIGTSTANVVRTGQRVESKPSLPTTPTKVGYTFTNWYDPSNNIWSASSQLNSSHMAAGSLKITARWAINPYTVSFNPDGGSPTPNAVMDDFDTVFVLPTVTKVGYTLKGWMNPSDVVVGQAGENYTIKGDITLKAKWEINDYTLSFVTENGVAAPADITKNYNTAIQLPNAPKTGYTLEGWYNSSGIKAGGVGSSYTIKKDEVLTARWLINSYTVSFNVDGATTTLLPITQNYNTTTILPNISKAGHTFRGWMNPSSTVVGVAGDTYTIQSNIILKAKWEINKYTLTFDSKGGTAPLPASISKNYQQQAGTLPVVSRVGYTFGGWFDTANQAITNTYSIEKNELIIAKWSPKTYTITFNNNGGNTATTPASVNIVFDTSIPALPTTGSGAPTKLGHTFVGWSTNSGATNTNNFVAGSNYAIDGPGGKLTVYAIWTQDSYSLKLNCNTPANSNTIIPVNYASVVVLPFEGDSLAPKRSGYELGGWSNSKTGPCDYVLGDNYTHTLETDKLLFADWSARSYQLVFDNNGGDTAANPTSKTVVFDQSVGVLPNSADGTAPTKAGHTFMGWTTDNGSTTVNFKDNSIYKTDSPSGSLTVYAVWEINTYKIQVETYEYAYDAIESTAVKTNSQTHNMTYGTTFVATPPVISEYSFIKADPSVKIDFVDNDATIKLYYQQVTYEIDYADQVVLNVSDKFPAKDNTLSVEDFFAAGNLSVTSSAADSRSFRSIGLPGNPQITNVGLNQIDYSKITTDFGQKVVFTFTWKSGQVKTAEFAVKISDNIAPVITMPSEQRFKFIHGLETVPTTETELLSLLYTKGLSVMDNYDGQIDPIITYVDGSFANIKWDQSGEHGILVGAVDSSGNLADKQKAVAIVWVADTSDNGNNSDNGGQGSGNGSDKDSTLTGDTNNNSANKNPGGNAFDENGNLVDSKGNKIVDASKLPEGSSLNAKGQLIDSKGNLINLKGSVGGSLPRTGAIVGSSLFVVMLIALLILLLLKKKKESAKQDKNQI